MSCSICNEPCNPLSQCCSNCFRKPLLSIEEVNLLSKDEIKDIEPPKISETIQIQTTDVVIETKTRKIRKRKLQKEQVELSQATEN